MAVAEAARLLGVTPGAIRKRIERGQLTARKISGQWLITVPDATAFSTTTRHDTTGQDATRLSDATGPYLPAIAYAQHEAIRDELLAPLVTRIGELKREAGRRSTRSRRLHDAPHGPQHGAGAALCSQGNTGSLSDVSVGLLECSPGWVACARTIHGSHRAVCAA